MSIKNIIHIIILFSICFVALSNKSALLIQNTEHLTSNPSIGLALDTTFKKVENGTYTLTGQVTFSKFITNGFLRIKIDDQVFSFAAPFDENYEFEIPNLSADGLKHQVMVWLHSAPDALVTAKYQAPVDAAQNKVVICSLLAAIIPGDCEVTTNTYDLNGQLILIDAPSSGQLTVQVGNLQQVYNAPFTSPLNFSLLGMVADGSDHKLKTTFSDLPTCTVEETFKAPAGCATDKCSISINLSPGACDNSTNQYNLAGNIFLDNNFPLFGNLIIQVSGTSIVQTFTPPFASDIPFVLPGLPADELEHEVVAYFEEDGFCSATALYYAPESCNPDCDADIIYWIGKCDEVTDTYVLHGAVVLSNPPTTGTMTITVNGNDLIYNAPFSPVVGYTFTALASDGFNHNIEVSFSGNLSCAGIEDYLAPDICSSCELAMEVVVGPCDPVTNTHTVSGRLVLTNPPTPGFLTVNIEGSTHSFYAPFKNKIHLFQIGSLLADGVIHDISAIFSLENSCVVADTYLAPICPMTCDFSSRLTEINCCKSCSSGNLEVNLLHWKEDYNLLENENVALNKRAMFLGTPNHVTSNAKATIDGKLIGDPTAIADYDVSQEVNDPWYYLDLIGNYDISTITISGRTDCCQSETYDYIIFISTTPFPDSPYTELMNDPAINHFNESVIGGNPFTINVNEAARFIRIQRIGYSRLALSEVEVLGSANLNSSPYSYQWNDANIGNVPNIECLSSGNYCVTVTDNQTGCTSNACFNVNN
jgi:hypothetical protein